MSELPAVRARDLIRVALAVGFVLDRQRGSHAVYFREADKRRIVIPIHSGTDLKSGTLRGIIADMGLTPEQFATLL